MVVYVDRDEYVGLKKLHPCPKSTQEMSFLIRTLRPGKVIVDPFAGTGSTLVAG